ncbi:MAG: efflux RND transporter periplasmic adaptor subunit, partial [Sphaerochaeta sp.]
RAKEAEAIALEEERAKEAEAIALEEERAKEAKALKLEEERAKEAKALALEEENTRNAEIAKNDALERERRENQRLDDLEREKVRVSEQDTLIEEALKDQPIEKIDDILVDDDVDFDDPDVLKSALVDELEDSSDSDFYDDDRLQKRLDDEIINLQKLKKAQEVDEYDEIPHEIILNATPSDSVFTNEENNEEDKSSTADYEANRSDQVDERDAAINYDGEKLQKYLDDEVENIEEMQQERAAAKLDYIEREKIRQKEQSKLLAETFLLHARKASHDSNEVPQEEVYPEGKNEETLLNKSIEENTAGYVDESGTEIEKDSVSKEDLDSKAKEGAGSDSKEEDDSKKENEKPAVTRQYEIITTSSGEKKFLLIKRPVVLDANKDVKNEKISNEEGAEDSNQSKAELSDGSGIKVKKENGVEYVYVNGIKIDSRKKVVDSLGLEAKKDEHQSITKEDISPETELEDTETTVRKELKKKSRKKRRNRILLWVILIIVFVGGSYLYNYYNTNRHMPWTDGKADIASQVTYTEVKVKSQVTSPEVDINGSLEAYDLQEVVLRADGAITSINVDEGDAVKKGDVLITVDDTDEQYVIANLNSELKSAKLTGNANRVKLIEMQLETAKNNLEYTKATANFDGVVARQNWAIGDYNSLTSSVNKSMIIADLSKFKATVQIDEIDIGYIEENSKAELTFDSLPGTVVDAYVSSIPMLGYYSKQGFGVLDVEITIPDPPKKLKTGFTFSGKIESGKEESITVVDQAAIVTSGDKTIVKQKMADGSIKDIPVTIRYLGENKCQILSGDIYVGDTVVIENSKTFEQETAVSIN